MSAKATLKNLLNRLPYVSGLAKELERYKTWYPPGHYYNPLTNGTIVGDKADTLFNVSRRDIPGVDLREDAQMALLAQLKPYYDAQPFSQKPNPKTRYYLHNDVYGFGDGLFLHTMLRHLRPKRIIEVGSGFSSAVMLDTNQLYFDGQMELTFIEPYPERLYGLLREGDKARANVLVEFVQNVPIATFERLQAGDLLFIDSSHVSKAGSDLNYLVFEVLPRLAKGVYIHIHDVFAPLEYPRDWVMDAPLWFGFNEIYLIRALLMYSTTFRVELFTHYIQQHHRPWFEANMPLVLANPGGSLYLQKV